jgi:hypothetical protein
MQQPLGVEKERQTGVVQTYLLPGLVLIEETGKN